LRAFVAYGFADAEPPELVRRTRLALDAYGRTFDVHRALARLSTERGWPETNRAPF
jgi:hypothetical protein